MLDLAPPPAENSRFRTLSECFEDTVKSVLFTSLESVLDGKTEECTRLHHQYVDSENNQADMITVVSNNDDTLVSKSFYINGKPVASLPPKIFHEMELIAETKTDLHETIPLECLPPPMCKGTVGFPDICLGFEKGNMFIEADVAGVDPDEISITFAGEYLNISGNATPDPTNPRVYLVKPKNAWTAASTVFKKQIYIDVSRFAIRKLKYDISNGILKITIPSCLSEENVIVFGNNKNTTSAKKSRKGVKLEETTEEE